MPLDQSNIGSAIENALQKTAEGEPRRSADIVFHMTDWLEELQRFCGFYISSNQILLVQTCPKCQDLSAQRVVSTPIAPWSEEDMCNIVFPLTSLY
jgi:hypothetical protein